MTSTSVIFYDILSFFLEFFFVVVASFFKHSIEFSISALVFLSPKRTFHCSLIIYFFSVISCFYSMAIIYYHFVNYMCVCACVYTFCFLYYFHFLQVVFSCCLIWLYYSLSFIPENLKSILLICPRMKHQKVHYKLCDWIHASENFLIVTISVIWLVSGWSCSSTGKSIKYGYWV